MKIVICCCHGGFDLSDRALAAYQQRKGITTDTTSADIPRNDPDLVAVVEELGRFAEGPCCDLKIVDIPDDVEFFIESHDGKERVIDVNRDWS